MSFKCLAGVLLHISITIQVTTLHIIFTLLFSSGMPDFSLYNIPKRWEIYQITTKYIKFQLNIPNYPKTYQNGRKIDQAFHCRSLQNLPTNFGVKIYYLATLLAATSSSKSLNLDAIKTWRRKSEIKI
jgi:hypothetical protein